MNRRNRNNAALLAAGLALVPCAFAGGLPATQLAAIHVDETLDPDTLAQADAASAGVVSSEQIAQRPLSRPAEVLEVVPGLIATQHSGDGKANQYFLRGFNLDHGTDLSTAIDDVPNNLRTHGHGQGYNDLNGLIPELIDSIEYRKGPYYADDGDFSSAGAVRIRYKDRLDHDFYAISGGEHGYVRGLLAASGDSADSRWLGAVDLGAYDGPWRKPADARKASLLLRHRSGDAERGLRLTLAAYTSRWDASDQIPLRAIRQGQIDRYAQIDPDLGGDTSRQTAAARYHLPLAVGELLLNAYAAHYDLRLYSNFTYFLADQVQGDEFEQRDVRNYYGGSVKYVQKWMSGSFAHELAVGMDTRYDAIGTVGLYHTAARQRLATVREDAVDQASAGLFASWSTRWSNRFRSIAGLRYDHYHAHVDSNIAANSGSTQDQRASPKLNLVLGPWHNTELLLNAGRGFHSNDARGSTLRVSPGDPAQAAQPQRLLVATSGYELGLRSMPTPTLALAFAAWRLRIGSELVFAGDGGTTEPSYPATRHGIELSAYYRPSAHWLIDADYARAHARFDKTNPAGTQVPNAIERTASLGVQWAGTGRWSAALRGRYLGPAPLLEDGSVRSSSTTVFNARADYRLSKDFTLSLDALNLSDSRDNDITYFYESQLPGETQPVADFHLHPIEPRQFRLTLRGTF
ncbi:MAG: TonB-dependent receptor [Rhodanobacteraceae bacterium]|nr:TonB-dependent receptor [Rhodanobacteraceae bacterium]